MIAPYSPTGKGIATHAQPMAFCNIVNLEVPKYSSEIPKPLEIAVNTRHNHRKQCGDYMWIYEYPNWPHFTWDATHLSTQLASVRYRQGHLLGHLEQLGLTLKHEATLNTLTHDVIKSSAIEGEHLNQQEVRSSIARRLGIHLPNAVISSRHVEGIVEMMLNATQQFDHPLTQERLFNWHAALFPTGRSGMQHIAVGQWRTAETGPMQVVSGPVGKEKIHFEAPHATRIPQEMQTFLEWFNSNLALDPILKAAIAHLWFITIHPFEDGNGRIARAISDMALARADGTCDRFYSLSSQIEAERKTYYEQLEKQQRNAPHITPWLEWFLNCLNRALENAETACNKVLFKSQLWRNFHQNPLNSRQHAIISRMLEDDFKGHINTSKYAKLAKCSTDTALRDIQDLKSRGVFIRNASSGRSTSYRLIETHAFNSVEFNFYPPTGESTREGS